MVNNDGYGQQTETKFKVVAMTLASKTTYWIISEKGCDLSIVRLNADEVLKLKPDGFFSNVQEIPSLVTMR